MPNKNADIGRNVEILFRNSISNYPDVVNEIKSFFKLTGNLRTAISTGIHAEKSDVKLEFEGGRNVDANVKAFKISGRGNQLTRKKIDKFCELFNLQPVQKIIQKCFVDRAKGKCKQSFAFETHPKLKPFFEREAKKIVEWSISFKKSREILVLFDRVAETFYIYPMKLVLKKLTYEINFSRIAGNIEIGKYIFIQRKAGNGKKYDHIKKYDLRHPGNDIQLKIRAKEFINDMKDILLASYTL